MEKIFESIANLFKVKTVVTLSLTAVFCVLAIKGVISGEQFLTIFTIIIGFYFGTQHEKNNKSEEDK